MGYRIPSEETLVAAVEEALVRHPVVDSQRQLGEHVRRVLAEEDERFRASDERVRRVSLEHGLATIRVRTGSTDETVREECPVCGAKLDQVANRTLEGGRTVVGADCPECPYAAGPRHEVPLRYEFVREEGPTVEEKGPF